MLYRVSKRSKQIKAPAFDVARGDQPMLTGYVGAGLALLGPLMLSAVNFDVFVQRLTLWLVALIVVLCGVDYIVQRKRLAYLRSSSIRTIKHLLIAAVIRWLAWFGILAVSFAIYTALLHYNDAWYNAFRNAYLQFLTLWLIAGIPYYLWTLRRVHGRRWDRRDPAVYVCIAARGAWRAMSKGRLPWHRFGGYWGSATARTTLLGLLVKAFFIPIMLTFFYHNAKNFNDAVFKLNQHLGLADAWTTGFYSLAYRLYKVCYEGLFMVDVTLAIIGYVVATRWLDNGIKSVEQTGLGWLACIGCYKPFNDVVSWYVRWPGTGIENMADTPLKLMAMAAIVGLLVVYVWATLAFGLRFSNLTYRGTFTQGPYRFVRHPAYISKNLAWWLEFLPSFTNVKTIFFMACWNGIYLVRALTEERHLKKFADYRAYCAHVRHRFVPGMF